MPRLDINGHLVDFEKMPTDAEIDEVASTLPSRSVTTNATSTAAPQPTPQEAPVDHSLGAAMYRRGIEQPMAAVAAAPGAAYELGKDWLVRGSFPPNSYAQAQESLPHALGATGITAPLGAPLDAMVGGPVEAATGSQFAGDVAGFVANLAAPLIAGKLATVFGKVTPPDLAPAAQVEQAVSAVVPAEAAAPAVAEAAPTAADTAGAAAFRKVSAPPAAADIPPAGPMPAERIDPAMFDRLYADMPGPTRSAMFQVAQDNAEAIAAQSRGTQSIERTRALAQHLEVPLDRVLPKGSALNAERSQAFIDTLGATQEKVDRLAAAVSGGQNDVRTKMALSAAQAENQVVLTSLFGTRAETGRALNVYKYMRQAMQLDDLKVMSQAQKLGADPEIVAEMLSKMPADDAIGRFGMLRDLNKPGAMDYLRSYYLTNILSGPRTHIRNVVGNATNLAYKMASTPFAATGDYMTTPIGTDRNVFAGELPKQLYGATTGMGEGFRKALFFLKEGFAPDVTVGGADHIPMELPGGLKNPYNFTGRALGAMDQFFETLASNVELHAGAYREARNSLMRQGLHGTALQDAMPDAVAKLIDEKPRHLMEQVATYAQHAVYHDQPGKFARGVKMAVNGFEVPLPQKVFGKDKYLRPLEYVIPFIKTPANIERAGIQASPLGYFTKAGRAAGRAGRQAKGEAALGTALLGFPAWLAATGRLSGSGPRDPSQVDGLRATGWQPNSIKLPLPDSVADRMGVPRSPEGEYWIGYSMLQPIAIPFAAVANGFEATAELKRQGKDVDWYGTAATVIGKVANTTLQQSFLQGAFAIANLLGNPEAKGEEFAAQLARGFVPMSAAVQTAAQYADPALRQPKGIAESVEAGIPTLTENVPPRLRATGEPIVRTGSPLSPVEMSPVRPDPMRQELMRLNIPLAPAQEGEDVGAFGHKFALSREDDFFIRQAKGQLIRSLLTKTMSTPAYQRAPDILKKELLEGQIGTARSMIRMGALVQKSKGNQINPDTLVPHALGQGAQ